MSGEEEVLQTLAELQRCKTGPPPLQLLRQFLKQSREARIKNSEDVAEYGALLLKHYRRSLKEEELWLVHEQVAMAAMDCNALRSALGLVDAVLQRFPTSLRARRLRGMLLEANGDTQAAEALYRSVLHEQPTNQEFAKRLVALHKTRGDLVGALGVLATYLDHYMGDKEAWEEAAELYLQVGLYRQAAFAFEELITLAPGHPNVYTRYADVLCTLGGAANVRTARAYYARGVAASGGRSARALWGVLSCAAQLGDKDAPASELPAAAAEQLLRLYEENAPDKVPAVKACLQQQGVLEP